MSRLPCRLARGWMTEHPRSETRDEARGKGEGQRPSVDQVGVRVRWVGWVEDGGRGRGKRDLFDDSRVRAKTETQFLSQTRAR